MWRGRIGAARLTDRKALDRALRGGGRPCAPCLLILRAGAAAAKKSLRAPAWARRTPHATGALIGEDARALRVVYPDDLEVVLLGVVLDQVDFDVIDVINQLLAAR